MDSNSGREVTKEPLYQYVTIMIILDINNILLLIKYVFI